MRLVLRPRHEVHLRSTTLPETVTSDVTWSASIVSIRSLSILDKQPSMQPASIISCCTGEKSDCREKEISGFSEMRPGNLGSASIFIASL